MGMSNIIFICTFLFKIVILSSIRYHYNIKCKLYTFVIYKKYEYIKYIFTKYVYSLYVCVSELLVPTYDQRRLRK